VIHSIGFSAVTLLRRGGSVEYRPPSPRERIMLCAACGQENRLGRKFCATCGAELACTCASCGTRNEPGEHFCGECGRRLDEAGVPAIPASSPTPTAFSGGRYQVRRFLGEGAKKRVYLAHDARLERDVAIALIKTEGLDEAGLARVRREARAMGRLGDHPHIVTVHDVGEEGSQPYIVSQYMSGGSVDDLLQNAEHHRLPLDRAIQLAEQVNRALEHAHTRGIIHRDLKPGNVWLTADGTAKLGDFGLAIALDRSRLTLEGMMVGTVAYMPPEQALGRTPDARSDLYALGVVLYEMVAGRPPFLGDDAVAIISQHINTPPVAPSWHNPEVPRALEALILRLLAKAPEERPESAAAVREALAAIRAVATGATTRLPAEETNPLDRLAAGVFVGREREMDELRAGLEDALSGRGRLLLLVGEPGIGKTRTAEELVTYARLRKAQILWGRCYEGDGAPAYWPWVQLIRSYVHDRDPQALVSEMGSGAGAIAQVVSEVRERLPGITAPPLLDPEQARFRLFDGITTFLKNAANGQPLVLVLDDLHWADKPSLLLLQFLARELRGARLLVIGTYRDVEVGRQHPLAQTLGELAREQLAERIILRGLSEHDVTRFIEITAGLRPPVTLVTAVYRETEGNPFFVNEVVRLLVADGRLQHPETVKSWSVGIPQSVREVVGRRLDRLSAECNQILTIGAVIGREFGIDVLERVCELRGDRLLDVLEEAVAARVITEVPRLHGRYIFSHALIRETLSEELTATRRIRLHRRIGEALEELYGPNPEPHLAELAYHFFEAAQGGDVDRAIAYAVRAGNRAVELMAHEEAVRHYETALQAFDMRQPRAEEQHCELLLTLTDTLWRAGEYDRAKEVSLQAAEIARTLGAADQLARAALGYGGRLMAFAALIRDETLVGLLEEALIALGEGDGALRALLLGRLAEEITFSDPYERRVLLCQQAEAMARRIGDSAVLATVLRDTHWALWTAENVEQRIGLATEIKQLAARVGDSQVLAEAHAFHFWDLVEIGDIAAAQREFERYARMAEDLKLPYLRWAVGLCRVLMAFVHGRLGEIEALAQETLHMGQDVQNQNAALVFGVETAMLLQQQGRDDELEPLLAGFVGLYPSIVPNLRCAQVVVTYDMGRRAEAQELFEHIAAQDFADLPANIAWLFSIAYLAEACHHLADVPRAHVLYQLLQPFATRNVTIGPVVTLGSASRYLALLAVTMGDRQVAARHFEDAIAMNRSMGTRHALAHTQAEYADLLLAQQAAGDRTKALDLLNQALETARELGMKQLVEEAVALKLRAQGVASGDFKTSIDAVTAAVQRQHPDLRSHAAPDGTVTLMFSDMEGFTAMTERLGDLKARDVIRDHNRIVREQLAAHGGFEVELQGDGFLLAFPSARRGLLCAIAIQREMAAYSAAHPEQPIRVRIGLHTGEALREADKFFGKTVILAARIAAQAHGGEILVSSLVQELTESAGDIQFNGARDVALKGLTGTYSLHVVSW
jgi:predicted ATPase/class 3 adenylate cyclase